MDMCLFILFNNICSRMTNDQEAGFTSGSH